MSGFLRKLFGQQLAPQSTDEESDLEKFYTDSEHARQVFEQLATSTTLPKRILVIHGLGGVGKSTLLKMYALTCRKYHIPSGLVASEEALSAVDVLAEWEGDLNRDGITLPTFQMTLNHYRAIQAKKEAARYALLLDPLSAAVCSPAEISALFDEMWEVERVYLEQGFSQ
jgi:predicted ATP-dependent serine protease